MAPAQRVAGGDRRQRLRALLQSPGIWFALPFIVLWWLSPLVARVISHAAPDARNERRWQRPTRPACACIARRTWRFFTTFVTAPADLLPPDNFQEDPRPVLAQRTSPTNIGLSLLASVTARDLRLDRTAGHGERLAGALDSISALPRYRGHLLQLVRH